MLGERILITGGAGFLGSHLCDRLVQEGAEVICLDSFVTGSVGNVAQLIGHPGFELVEHNITRPYEVDRPVSAVLHLASLASPPAYLRHPIHSLKVGGLGTLHALGIARRHGSRFLLTSTSEVYGDPEVSPQAESYRGNVSCTGPRSVYDEAKRYSEALAMAYHRAHGVAVRIARIFNTYGPRLSADDGRVISNFASQAIAGEPLTVYGDGSQTRSFCYVDDLVEGLVRLLRSDEVGPVNLGNPDERPVLDVARLIIGMTGSSSPIVFRPLPDDDPKQRCPDITLARRALGWEPVIDLEGGLSRTLDWFRRLPG